MRIACRLPSQVGHRVGSVVSRRQVRQGRRMGMVVELLGVEPRYPRRWVLPVSPEGC